MYNNNKKKIGFIISFMTSGNATKWQIAKRRELKKKGPDTTPPTFSSTWKDFAKDLNKEFTLIDDKGKAGTDLMTIRQGDWLVEAYIADFKIIISWSEIMEDVALIQDFQKGLNPKLVENIWAQMPPSKTIDK